MHIAESSLDMTSHPVSRAPAEALPSRGAIGARDGALSRLRLAHAHEVQRHGVPQLVGLHHRFRVYQQRAGLLCGVELDAPDHVVLGAREHFQARHLRGRARDLVALVVGVVLGKKLPPGADSDACQASRWQRPTPTKVFWPPLSCHAASAAYGSLSVADQPPDVLFRGLCMSVMRSLLLKASVR